MKSTLRRLTKASPAEEKRLVSPMDRTQRLSEQASQRGATDWANQFIQRIFRGNGKRPVDPQREGLVSSQQDISE